MKRTHSTNARDVHPLLCRLLQMVTAREARSSPFQLVKRGITAFQCSSRLVEHMLMDPVRRSGKQAPVADAGEAPIEGAMPALLSQRADEQSKQVTRERRSRRSTNKMRSFPPQGDACIMCALEEEVAAVEEVVSAQCHVAFTTGVGNSGRYVYRYATITNTRQEPLTLLLFCQTRPGPLTTALDVQMLLQEFQPHFLAMSGICAGDKHYLQLGDLVVAEYAYHYQTGKMEHGPQGVPIHRPEWITYGPAKRILQYVRSFTAWETPVGNLRRPDQKQERPKRFVTAMASGMTVQSADPFPELQRHNRKTWALDMETAAFYQTLQEFPQIASLVVKGVSDYADPSKNDQYHAYAARASASYLLSFIQEYLSASRHVREKR